MLSCDGSAYSQILLQSFPIIRRLSSFLELVPGANRQRRDHAVRQKVVILKLLKNKKKGFNQRTTKTKDFGQFVQQTS